MIQKKRQKWTGYVTNPFDEWKKDFDIQVSSTDLYVNCVVRTFSPVGWGFRIHQLHLFRGVRPSPNECLDYDIKQSDGEAPV